MQPVGNVLSRTGSFGSNNQSANVSEKGGSPVLGVTRQGSQGSILEHFTSHAKELVNRQGSQEGLLAHMDKV